MSPAWAIQQSIVVPQPLRPYEASLIHWVRGDAGLQLDAPTRVGRWVNQHGPNDDLTSGDPGPVPSSLPYALGDTIDGVPLVTFGVGVDANKGLRTGAPNPGAASNLVNTLTAPMDGSSPRAIFTMMRPDFQAAFARIGGNPWAHSTWGAIFSIWAGNPASNGIAWSHAWQSLDVAWSTPAGAGSIYNGAPTLVEWRSAAWPAFEFLVNNALVATVPTDISTWAPGGSSPLVMAGPGNPSFLGGIAESLYYDEKLAAAAHTKTINYLISRYPSAPIVPDA